MLTRMERVCYTSAHALDSDSPHSSVAVRRWRLLHGPRSRILRRWWRLAALAHHHPFPPVWKRAQSALKKLANCQDIPFAVFEPCRLGSAAGSDAVLHRDARHFIFLELHSPALQLFDFSFHIFDLPKCLIRLRRSCIRSGIKEDISSATFINDAAGEFNLSDVAKTTSQIGRDSVVPLRQYLIGFKGK
jgi:hypothetical protein